MKQKKKKQQKTQTYLGKPLIFGCSSSFADL